ncbi:MAG TPA: hypothetical protein VE270_02385 [Thermoleophilaceae bacterium]|nr:hypothetical protein [Thermoleophilaceae bacterium]
MFIAIVELAWEAVAPVPIVAIVHGQLGSLHGRRLPDGALRTLTVVVGLVAMARLVAGWGARRRSPSPRRP